MNPSAWAATLAAVALVGCAAPGGRLPSEGPVPAAPPAAWQAPLPHGGTATELARWWSQFQDPALPPLIEAAQAASPTLAAAHARIERARAVRTAAGAALLPRLDAVASASTGRPPRGKSP